MCILRNKHRGTKNCWRSVISSHFSLYLREAIRAQDNRYVCRIPATVKWHLAIQRYFEDKKGLCAWGLSVYPCNTSSAYILKASDLPPLQHQLSHNSDAPSNNPKIPQETSPFRMYGWEETEKRHLTSMRVTVLPPQSFRCWMGRKDMTQTEGLLLMGQIKLLCWLYAHHWHSRKRWLVLALDPISPKGEKNKTYAFFFIYYLKNKAPSAVESSSWGNQYAEQQAGELLVHNACPLSQKHAPFAITALNWNSWL